MRFNPHLAKKRIGDLDVLFLKGDAKGDHIFLFHGYGANALDLSSLSQILGYQHSPSPHWYFPEGFLEIPIGSYEYGKAWFPIDIEKMQKEEYSNSFPEGLEAARESISKMLKEIDPEPSKIILGGFSQGAMVSTDFFLYSDHNIKDLVLFSGGLISQNKWYELASKHKGQPFFQSHGIKDALLSLESAKKLNLLLDHAGMKGEFISFHGGHEIPSQVLEKVKKRFLR